MLVNKLLRPVANNLYKVPTRSTSAVCGARSRHVSTAVSYFPIRIFEFFVIFSYENDLFPFSFCKKSIRFSKIFDNSSIASDIV